jgi:hypothetical protein
MLFSRLFRSESSPYHSVGGEEKQCLHCLVFKGTCCLSIYRPDSVLACWIMGLLEEDLRTEDF